MLKATSILCHLLTLILNYMAIELALSFLAPPLVPFIGMIRFCTYIAFSSEIGIINLKNDIDINNLTANKFNQFMLHTLTGGRTTSHNYRCLTTFDNNGASDYAWRRSANGGTDVANSSTQSQNYIDFDDGLEDACDKFYIIYCLTIYRYFISTIF